MRLVIYDEERNVFVADYGAFSKEQADHFFADALSAIAFRKEFPKVVVQNEVQLRLLTETLAKMGLLHGNPEAIQQWMRPYISNEVQRLNRRENAFQRASNRISEYREMAWDWIKAEIFGGVSNIIRKIINHFRK